VCSIIRNKEIFGENRAIRFFTLISTYLPMRYESIGKLIRKFIWLLRDFNGFLETPKSLRDFRSELSKEFPEMWRKPFHGLGSEAPMDVVKAKEILLKTCEVLKENEVNYRVVFGTLLGLYRAGEIISHDTDLDLAVPDSSLSGVLTAVHVLIDDNAFELVRCNDHIISLSRDGIYIDLYLFQTKRLMYLFDRAVLTCSEMWLLRSEDFTCDTTVKCDSFELATIADPEKFFLNYYGADWKVPIRGLHADIRNKTR